MRPSKALLSAELGDHAGHATGLVLLPSTVFMAAMPMPCWAFDGHAVDGAHLHRDLGDGVSSVRRDRKSTAEEVMMSQMFAARDRTHLGETCPLTVLKQRPPVWSPSSVT